MLCMCTYIYIEREILIIIITIIIIMIIIIIINMIVRNLDHHLFGLPRALMCSGLERGVENVITTSWSIFGSS